MLNKKAVASKLAEAQGTTKKDAEANVEAVFAVVTELMQEDTVRIAGFGDFLVRERATRTGRNPQSGEEIQIPATKAPAFKPAKGLKDAVKG